MFQCRKPGLVRHTAAHSLAKRGKKRFRARTQLSARHQVTARPSCIGAENRKKRSVSGVRRMTHTGKVCAICNARCAVYRAARCRVWMRHARRWRSCLSSMHHGPGHDAGSGSRKKARATSAVWRATAVRSSPRSRASSPAICGRNAGSLRRSLGIGLRLRGSR